MIINSSTLGIIQRDFTSHLLLSLTPALTLPSISKTGDDAINHTEPSGSHQAAVQLNFEAELKYEGSVCSQNVIIIIKIPISSSRNITLLLYPNLINQIINIRIGQPYRFTGVRILLSGSQKQTARACLQAWSLGCWPMELQGSRQKARECEGPSQHGKKAQQGQTAREGHSAGYSFSQLLQETIVEVISNLQANHQQAEQQLRRQIKRIESFDIKEVSFKECHGYCLLSKLYYLEEKCKELKISFAKASKQKNHLLDKVKAGLRRHDHLEQMYSVFADSLKPPAREKETKS